MNRIREAESSAWWIPGVAFVPFGWFIWASFLIAGVRSGRTRWKVYGAMYLAACFLPILTDALVNDDPRDSSVGLTILAVWIIGLVHAFLIRPQYVARMASPVEQARHDAEGRVRTRHEALELAEREPEVAREMGIGRPDVPGAQDCELIDVNHVSRLTLETLPGIAPETALAIAKARTEVGGFTSLADFGMVMDLDGDTVESLRGHVVFL